MFFKTLIYPPKHEFSGGGPQRTDKVPTSAYPKRISKKTNELEWSWRREAREGPATVKDVLLSKGAAD